MGPYPFREYQTSLGPLPRSPRHPAHPVRAPPKPIRLPGNRKSGPASNSWIASCEDYERYESPLMITIHDAATACAELVPSVEPASQTCSWTTHDTTNWRPRAAVSAEHREAVHFSRPVQRNGCSGSRYCLNGTLRREHSRPNRKVTVMATQKGAHEWGAPVDVNVPSLSRIYDYLLGGGHNLASDRAVADAIMALVPRYDVFVRENRAFVYRAVLHMLAAGIDQFLDLGAGLGGVRHVHELAQAEQPQARVVYIDCDPVVIARLNLIVHEDDPRTG